ncbi:MAG: hypothetical protein K2K06_04575 [Oscillospiraceae bacterium]|nr:hypothetical protein [Oscillospiraceae bacterium]
MNANKVTCSFVMDRDTYNAYKSIVSRNGENVKGNIVRHMQNVIQYDTSNVDPILAIREIVQSLKKDANKKIYDSLREILKELEEDA